MQEVSQLPNPRQCVVDPGSSTCQPSFRARSAVTFRANIISLHPAKAGILGTGSYIESVMND
jgi:hypothetical protein